MLLQIMKDVVNLFSEKDFRYRVVFSPPYIHVYIYIPRKITYISIYIYMLFTGLEVRTRNMFSIARSPKRPEIVSRGTF